MEVYILDNLLRRIDVVDTFESLIWTERFTEIGDFNLSLTSTARSRSLFTTGTQLAINGSYRVMTVESVEDSTGDDGLMTLTVKGKSLEALLKDRIAYKVLAAPNIWSITDTPANIARQVFTEICVNGTLDLNDKIPFIQSGNFFGLGTIPEPTEVVTRLPGSDILYNFIKELCDMYEMGFRLVRNFDESELYFEIYMGDDRTTAQSILTPVVLGTSFDSLENTTSYDTIEGYKNVAYVILEDGTIEKVYPAGVPAPSGFDRHILIVTPEAEHTTTELRTQFAREELARYRNFNAFDGEINQKSNYRYGINYGLGDLVEIRNDDEVASIRRVTEQIFIHDKEGERSYPTLTAPEA